MFPFYTPENTKKKIVSVTVCFNEVFLKEERVICQMVLTKNNK